MAIGPGMQWELRTTGSNENGAGFDPTIAGAGNDYSQQDNPQLNKTDLATPGAGSTTLTSASGGFTAAMVGNVIYIRSGINFTVGAYVVVSFTNSNTVTLDRTPTPSGAGSGGAGKLGGAGATIQHIQSRGVAGNTYWFKYSTTAFTFAASHELEDGTLNSWTRYIGYVNTRGDGGAKGTTLKPRLLATANGVSIFRNSIIGSSTGRILIENLEFDGGKLDGRTETKGVDSPLGNSRILNCRVKNCQRAGIVLQSGGEVFQTDISGCGQSTLFSEHGAIYCSGGTPFIRGCYIHDNTTNGIHVSTGSVWVDHTLILRNGPNRSGMYVGTGCLVTNCTIHGNGLHGIYFYGTGTQVCSVIDTLLTSNLGKGLEQEFPPYDQILVMNCAGWNNGSGDYDAADFQTVYSFQSLTSDPYVNSAADDFRIKAGAGGGNLVVDNGSLGQFPNGTVGRMDIGAIEMGMGFGGIGGTIASAFVG